MEERTVGEIVGDPPQEQVLYSVMRMGTFASAAARTPSEFQEVYEGTTRHPSRTGFSM